MAVFRCGKEFVLGAVKAIRKAEGAKTNQNPHADIWEGIVVLFIMG